MISERTERSMPTDQVSQLLQLQSNSCDESKMVCLKLENRDNTVYERRFKLFF